MLQNLIVSSKARQPSKKQTGKGVRFAEVDLEEEDDAEVTKAMPETSNNEMSSDEQDDEEEEEEEGEDDEFIDVLDVLDGRGEPDTGDDNGTQTSELSEVSKIGRSEDQQRTNADGWNNRDKVDEGDDESVSQESIDDDDDEGVNSDDDIVISGSEYDDADSSALDKLDELVSGLETGSKRKTLDDDGTDADASAGLTYAKKKKRLARDATENGVENEFGAKASGQLLAFLCDISQGSLKL